MKSYLPSSWKNSRLISGALGGLLSAPVLLASSALAAPADNRPNIVVILADDMGYSDIGSFGGEISTPNLDNLAKNGVRFTQFYNTARCCPTRASLLTGVYPHQAGVGHMTDERRDAQGQVLPGYSGRLNDRCVTIAETLKGAGYFTAMAGKWHVGQNFGVTPTGRGFDRALHAAAGGFYFSDSPRARLFLNGKSVGNNGAPLPQRWYSSDLWTDYGLKFVDEAEKAQKPFFLYIGENAPHFPLQAPAADIARWRGKFKKDGWDKLRTARYQRQLQSGVVDKKWPLSPRPEAVPAWDSLTPKQQDRFDQIMATYAATVEHMDTSIGRLVSGLKARGELDNTLILFLSDNGGNAESGINGRLEGANPGDALSDVYVGQSWATLNNTPFVRYKHYTDEGGISTPLIAHWPKGIPRSRNGALEKQPGHVIDIMATCVDLAKASYPTRFHDKPIQPFEGVSLRPAFSGQPLKRTQPLFWEHEGNRAIRQGDWKLVALENGPWRLYNLSLDRSEQQDLATNEPARVKSLANQWNTWAARANVLPLGGWRGEGKKPKKRGPGAAADGASAGSELSRFDLRAGQHLNRDEVPAIVNRDVTITAIFDAQQPNGVIVAQGGSAHGYALYLESGKLTFLLRVANQATQVATVENVIGRHTAVAKLGTDGTLSLSLDSQPVGTVKAPTPVTRMPTDGLDIGSDQNGHVGNYKDDNHFGGSIESVQIVLIPKAAS
jgi:arylsulfatase A-like enzyme